MSVKIGNIDIGQSVVELEYQTKLNSLLIELMLNRNNSRLKITQLDIKTAQQKAAIYVNNKYGKQLITMK
jgi:hypothetical protein